MSASCSSYHPSKSLSVFSFCPDIEGSGTYISFYKFPFKAKLAFVVNAINKASAIIDELPAYPNHANLFIAPEFTFYDYSQAQHRRFYTKREKNEFKKEMLALSERIDLIIAPGTFLWSSINKSGDTVYRNNLYMFYKGEVKVCHKKFPHVNYDHDYRRVEGFIEGHYEFLRFYESSPKSYFQYKPNDTGIIKIADLTFGVEICYDTVRARLRRALQKTKKMIDVHLVVGSGIRHGGECHPVQPSPYLAIHTDRAYKASLTSKGTSIRTIPKNYPSLFRRHFVYQGYVLTTDYKEDILYKDAEKPLFQFPVTLLFNYPPQKIKPSSHKFQFIIPFLESDRLEEAQATAHGILGSDYDLKDLSDLYHTYADQGYYFDALQTFFAIPKEQQREEQLAEFYYFILLLWVRRKGIDNATSDAFIKCFCYALEKNGLLKIALGLTRLIHSTSLKNHVIEELEKAAMNTNQGHTP